MTLKERILNLASNITRVKAKDFSFNISSLGIIGDYLTFNLVISIDCILKNDKEEAISLEFPLTKNVEVDSNVDTDFLIYKDLKFVTLDKKDSKFFDEQKERIKDIMDNSGILKRTFKIDKELNLYNVNSRFSIDNFKVLDLLDEDESFNAYIEDIETSFREQGILK